MTAPISDQPEHTTSTVTPPAPETGPLPQVPPVAAVPLGAGFETRHVGGLPVSTAGKRLGAYLLDIVLMVVTLGLGWLIWSVIIWSKGQSPAKALLGMRCVRTDTAQAAGWGTMALREIVGKSIIGAVTFGLTNLVSFFMILGDGRQTVWDKVATTTVVNDPDGRLLRR